MSNPFELYKKCVRGECTPEEASQVAGWLKEDPKAFEAEMLAELMQMEMDKEMPDKVREEMLEAFRRKGLPLAAVPVIRKLKWVRWVAAAAVLIGVIAGVGLLSRSSSDARSATWVRILNDRYAARLVVLPDSSRVWLNAFAEISYPEDLDRRKEREIMLVGEASFVVNGQSNKGFVVRTGNLQTWVLGTEFNIAAYPDEDMVKVSLQKGKIRVNYINTDGSRSEGKVLSPGEEAMYRKSNFWLSTGRSAVEEPNAWIKEGMVFNDVPLRNVLRRISKKYDRAILFDTLDVDRFHHITARYEEMPLDQILTQLGFTCDFNFKKDSNSYKIFFKSKHGIAPAHKKQP